MTPPPYRTTLTNQGVTAAVGDVLRREWPSPYWYWGALAVVLFVAIQLGQILAFLLVQRLPHAGMFTIGPYFPAAITAFVVLLSIAILNAVHERAIQRGTIRMLNRLDVPDKVEAVFEVLEDGLQVDTGRAVLIYRWKAIGDVVRIADGWVVRSDANAMFIPSAGFADGAAERDFIAAILPRLSDAARERSGAAREFASADQDPISA